MFFAIEYDYEPNYTLVLSFLQFSPSLRVAVVVRLLLLALSGTSSAAQRRLSAGEAVLLCAFYFLPLDR